MALRMWGQYIIQADPPAEDPVMPGTLWYDSSVGALKICTTITPYTFVNAGAGPIGLHHILSTTHSDTTPDSAVRGDLITAQGASPLWTRLALGTATKYLRSDGTDVGWSALLVTDLPATVVLTTGSYADPAWITSLAWSKITSTPTTLAGYGITDPIVLTSGSYANPAWITSLAWSKITGTPTTLAGYGVTAGALNTMLRSDGTNWITSTPTFSQTPTSGTYFRGDGTNWITSTLTLPNAATTGDVLYATASNAIGNLAAVATGAYLRSAGTSTAPVWSTLTLPNAATTGDLLYASASNTISNLADVAAGSYLRSGGVTTAPVWSTLILPNAATVNQVVYATSSNTYGGSANLNFNGTGLALGTTILTSFNGTGNAKKMVVAGSGSSTTVADNDVGLVIVNIDTTTNNTSGLHFGFQDSDGTPNYISSSIIGINGARTLGQYSIGTMAFLTSSTANTAPSEKMRIHPTGGVSIGTTSDPGAANFTLTGLVTGTGFGTNSFIGASATNGQILSVRQTTDGATCYGEVQVGASAAATTLSLRATAASYTPATIYLASGASVDGQGAGGLSLAATNAGADVRVYNRGGTLAATWGASQALTLTGALSATTITGTSASTHKFGENTSGNKILQLGGTPGANDAVFINMIGSTTQYNWSIRTNTAVAGAFELYPSTATGGATFSANVWQVTQAGNVTATGSDTATAFIPSGSTVPTNGLYLPASNTLNFSTNTTARMQIKLGVTVGGTTDPGATNLRVEGTSALVGQVITGDGSAGTPAIRGADTDTGLYWSGNTVNVTAAGTLRASFAADASGGLSLSTDLTMGAANQIFIDAGTVGAPSISLSANPDTGIYTPSTIEIAFAVNAVQVVNISRPSSALLELPSAANGTGAVTGNIVRIGRNTSGGTAAGALQLIGKGGASNFVWADASAAPGVLRIGTGAPEEDGTPSDTSGTVVGAQSSSRDTKNIIGLSAVTPRMALDAMIAAPVFDFTYKGGAYCGTQFTGLTVDDSPWIGMDPDEQHPFGRSFNPITAHGYTVLAIQALHARLAILEAALAPTRSTRTH